jgi:hypothetical protein
MMSCVSALTLAGSGYDTIMKDIDSDAEAKAYALAELKKDWPLRNSVPLEGYQYWINPRKSCRLLLLLLRCLRDKAR